MKCQTCTQPEGGESAAAERVVAHVRRLYTEPCGTCAETCVRERATVHERRRGKEKEEDPHKVFKI